MKIARADKPIRAGKSLAFGEAFAAGQETVAVWQRHAQLRRQALAQVTEKGLATRGREDWVHGTTGDLLAAEVLPLAQGTGAPDAKLMTTLPQAHRLVFVNGTYAAEHSRIGDLPDGVVLAPLADADDQVELGAAVAADGSAITALNTVFWRDGLHLDIPAGVSLDQPIELQFINDLAAERGMVPIRNLITVGRGGSVTVVERSELGCAGVVEQPLTEILCAAESRVDHIKLVGGASAGQHFGSTHVVQQSHSRYRSWEIVTGGRLARREIHLDLAGTGGACDLNALYLGHGDQRFDLRTRVDHNAPECETRELYKGILNDRARGVFDGLIRVARDSQQTSAHQTNRNLLLSDDAVVNSIPRLEIYADDVKCSHGSTTGQLEDEQLFYLRTRGFSPAEARAYLALAFASEVIASLPVAELRDELSALVTRNLAAAGIASLRKGE